MKRTAMRKMVSAAMIAGTILCMAGGTAQTAHACLGQEFTPFEELERTWGYDFYPTDINAAEYWSPDARGILVDLTHDGKPEIVCCTPGIYNQSVTLMVYQYDEDYDPTCDDPMILLYSEEIGGSHCTTHDVYLYESEGSWYLMYVTDTVYGGVPDQSFNILYLDEEGYTVYTDYRSADDEPDYGRVLANFELQGFMIIDSNTAEIENLEYLAEVTPSAGSNQVCADDYADEDVTITRVDTYTSSDLIGTWDQTNIMVTGTVYDGVAMDEMRRKGGMVSFDTDGTGYMSLDGSTDWFYYEKDGSVLTLTFEDGSSEQLTYCISGNVLSLMSEYDGAKMYLTYTKAN